MAISNEAKTVALHAYLYDGGDDDFGIDAHSVCSENATVEDIAKALISLIHYSVRSPEEYESIFEKIKNAHDHWIDNYNAQANLSDEDFIAFAGNPED